MTRWRVLLGLYLIGFFRSSLYTTVSIKIQRYVFDNNGFNEVIYDWQIYLELWFIAFTIITSIILYQLSSIETNENLTKIHESVFLKELSIYSGVYLLGYLTLSAITLLILNINDFASASNFQNDVMTLFGSVDLGSGSFYLNLDNKLKFILVSFMHGVSSAFLTILVLVTSNMIHLKSQNTKDELLYPLK